MNAYLLDQEDNSNLETGKTYTVTTIYTIYQQDPVVKLPNQIFDAFGPVLHITYRANEKGNSIGEPILGRREQKIPDRLRSPLIL